jgi:cytochrome b subunit of formate dehydrogenase
VKPSPVAVRRSLHHFYAVSAIALMATGIFLTLPDLRANLIGGYGRQILDLHLWAGWVFLAAPPLALALAARPLLADLRERLADAEGRGWRRIHIVSSLAAGFLLGATGIVMWLDVPLQRDLGDLVTSTHEVLSWVVIVELGGHLLVARRKIVERARTLLGARAGIAPEQELFDFVDED